ncbi:MAG: LysR family transcriptional regulator [Pseudomonadota bacterium]|nr:LysR family transcriptional regulator [Pseudomonadota bacterium]
MGARYFGKNRSLCGKIAPMFIRQLDYLVTLAREKHFAKAAEVCHVSQPALSSGIRSLERELGIMIVQRGRRFMGLTTEGERVLVWAQQTLASLAHMREDASVAKSAMVGTLRIGAIPTTMAVAAFLTAPWRAAYPNIRYTLSSSSAEGIVNQLDHFELDLGLTYLDDTVIGGFEKLHLFDERYVLLANHEALLAPTLTWEQAARLPLCLLTAKMRNRQVIDSAFRSAGAKPDVIIETDSLFTLYAHVSEAGLFSIVPHSLLDFFDLSRRVQVRPLLPQLTRAIGLIARKQPALALAPVTGAVWDIARDLSLQARFDLSLA